MTPRIFLILGALLILAATSTSEKCDSVTQEDCENLTSEYEKYRECMERRTKRSADCYESEEVSCDSCNCNSCSYSTCDNNCNNNCCERCCQSQKSTCTTSSCCHQTCRAECRSHSCRSACKKKCQNGIITGPSQTVVTDTKTSKQHNITTVIHLNNVINNTNLINLPIKINSTIFNNITGGYSGGYVEDSKQKCCMTIGPRQCVPQSTFPYGRCFHIRKKACGSICSAPVVHYQSHEICDNDVNNQQPCHQQIVYIPQPQPRCAYQQAWPYVTCGNQGQQSCDGCYSHYIRREDVTKCSSFCYDDGYGLGPYYRQGPFYRPGYAHAPSCYQTGLCDNEYSGGYGYGYEGLPGYGFPNAYPAETYPFVIEDWENSTFSSDFGTGEVIKGYKNLEVNKLPLASDKIVKIDADVDPSRNQRYAEILIRTTEKSKMYATTVGTAETTTTPA